MIVQHEMQTLFCNHQVRYDAFISPTCPPSFGSSRNDFSDKQRNASAYLSTKQLEKVSENIWIFTATAFSSNVWKCEYLKKDCMMYLLCVWMGEKADKLTSRHSFISLRLQKRLWKEKNNFVETFFSDSAPSIDSRVYLFLI